jgi:chromate transporter
VTELAWLFLKLGCTAFGGPAAHIAVMREEVVVRRAWLTEQEFLDLLGATNLIPGPSSTEMAIHIGYLRGGWKGMLLAGACFILPAALIVAALAHAYITWGSLPATRGMLYALKPVILAVVVQAIASLLKPALKTRSLQLLAAVVLIAALLQVNELLLLFGAGALKALGAGRPSPRGLLVVAALALVPGALALVEPRELPFSNTALFLFFLKVGSVLYGSGYVLLAFLRGALVQRWSWLTEAQLLDATVIGQITPGPLFTTATFIGYMLSGPVGAAWATLAIFLPGFLFVALSGPLIPRLRRSPVAGAFLDGVNAAALALMLAVTLQLGHDALEDVPTVLLAAFSAVLLVRYRINSAWLLASAALLGLLHAHVFHQ